jgi:hypothetical protein
MMSASEELLGRWAQENEIGTANGVLGRVGGRTEGMTKMLFPLSCSIQFEGLYSVILLGPLLAWVLFVGIL